MEDVSIAQSVPLVELPESLQAPTHLVRAGYVTWLTLANMSLMILWTGVGGLLLPYEISKLAPANKSLIFGLLTGIAVLVALVANPIAGALSDRTTSRFGRRRPWIVVAAILTTVGLGFMWQASSIPMLFIGYCAIEVFSNFVLAPLTATIPDQVPEIQRGTVSGISGLATSLGGIVGAVLVGQVFKSAPANAYPVVGLIVLVASIIFVMVLRDKSLPKAFVPAFHLSAFLKAFWISPRKYPDFSWAFLTRFVPFIGYFLGTTYMLYYLQDSVKYPAPLQGASTFSIITTAVSLVSTIIGGFLSDRLGRRKIFVTIGMAIMAVGLALLAAFHVWQVVLVAGAVLGLGFGMYMAVDIAIVTLVLPSSESRAKDMGIVNIANTLPHSLAPLLAGFVLTFLGHSYTLLYVLAAAFVLLGMLTVRPIKAVR